ncbi:MAG: serine/threonine-protein phosphatase [Rhodocyclaceae bacterium]|nr:serine/threonine-protein phosphatase [Rhodocyclaceae bacterium]
MALSVETCVARHQGDRREQQDRVEIFGHPTMGGMMMAVLADGMGGHSGGAMAAEQVLLKARQNFEMYAPRSETPDHLLKEIIEEAHLVIKLTRFTSEKDPHSTAVVLLLQPGRIDWAHCGDSRLYYFRQGQLVSKTEDQSLVEQLVRKGVISAEAAMDHPHRNVLLSCLGADNPPKVIHDKVGELRAGDAFLLCSDGLWAYFDDAELGRTLNSFPPRVAAEHLIGLARERAEGEGDNISVAIVKLVEVPAQAKPGIAPRTGR